MRGSRRFGAIGDFRTGAARRTGGSRSPLADAERETRINRRYLEALETEDDSAAPAVYTRGFIRTYCHYLGLNPDAMLDAYGPRQVIEDAVQIRPISADVRASRSISFRPAVVLAGLIVASLLAVYLWGQYTSFRENVEQIESMPTSRADRAGATARTPSPSPARTGRAVAGPPSPSPAALVVPSEGSWSTRR